MAMMLSAAMMLKHIGEEKAASNVESAIAFVISKGRTVTYDLKPNHNDATAATTFEVADAVCNKLKEATYHA